jgi:hypothetical protein
MELSVSGTNSEHKFKHLWGRYILGFKPQRHCIRCFETNKAPDITPEMTDGIYPLRTDLSDLFYLCGVGQPDTLRDGEVWKRKFTNVHLAVTPRQGSVASIGSVYGVTFTIIDAEAIPIQSRLKGFQGLPNEHSQCKNFQFGYQVFDVNQVSSYGLDEVTRARRKAK